VLSASHEAAVMKNVATTLTFALAIGGMFPGAAHRCNHRQGHWHGLNKLRQTRRE